MREENGPSARSVERLVAELEAWRSVGHRGSAPSGFEVRLRAGRWEVAVALTRAPSVSHAVETLGVRRVQIGAAVEGCGAERVAAVLAAVGWPADPAATVARAAVGVEDVRSVSHGLVARGVWGVAWASGRGAGALLVREP